MEAAWYEEGMMATTSLSLKCLVGRQSVDQAVEVSDGTNLFKLIASADNFALINVTF